MVNSVSIIGRFDAKQESFENIEHELKNNLDKYVGVNKNEEPNNEKCDLQYLLHKKAGRKITTCSENNNKVTQSNVEIAKQLANINKIFNTSDESELADKIKTILTNLQVAHINRSFFIAYFPYTIKNGTIDVVDGKILHIVFDENGDYTTPIQTKNVNITNNKIYPNVLPVESDQNNTTRIGAFADANEKNATGIQKTFRGYTARKKYELKKKQYQENMRNIEESKKRDDSIRNALINKREAVLKAEEDRRVAALAAEENRRVAALAAKENIKAAGLAAARAADQNMKNTEAERLENNKEATNVLRMVTKTNMITKLNLLIKNLDDRSFWERLTHADREKHNAKKQDIIDDINTEIDVYNDVYKDKPPIEKLRYDNIDKINQYDIKKNLITIKKIININTTGGKLTHKTQKIKSTTRKSTTLKRGRKTNKSKKVSISGRPNFRQTRRTL